MKIFVTGGAGVIGSEMVPMLVAQGHEVIVGDLKARPWAFHESVSYLHLDLRNLDQETFSSFGVEVIFHLAATFERSAESLGFWEESYRHNIELSHHIASLARRAPTVRRLVFASSYLVYDPGQYLFAEKPLTPVVLGEESIMRPRNLVGMAKLYHESELRFLSQFRETEFSSVSARIFRGYGKGSRDVISRWVRSLLKGQPIEVYRPEGLFDYIFAADTAQALISLGLESSATEPVNVGSGRARSVDDIVQILASEFPIAEIVTKESDVLIEASQSNNSLVRKFAGWEPQYSLEQGISQIVEYERYVSRGM